MKPAAFDYVAADSIDMALGALAQAGGDAKILAGGQSLVPMLNFRLLRPAVLVDINRISGLAFIREEEAAIRIGALTRHHAVETSPVIAKHLPVLSEAMTYVAHLAIRNRGTLGGSLSHADPAAELPMMALLLDAVLQVAAASGARAIKAADFFRDALTVDLAADEMVTEVVVPKLPPGTGWGFAEISRRAGDFALAAVAVTLGVTDGAIAQPRVALTGMGGKPLRLSQAEALLAGRALDETLSKQLAETVRAGIAPHSDLHASADFRRHLAGVLAVRATEAAWQRARAHRL
jgi:carbon-monoxide dehydrogenase medium subunit